MSYDILLGRSGTPKLGLFRNNDNVNSNEQKQQESSSPSKINGHNSTTNVTSIQIDENEPYALEEQCSVPIIVMKKPPISTNLNNVTPPPHQTHLHTSTINSATTTPVRKTSTSKFMNAFAQFYSSDTSTTATATTNSNHNHGHSNTNNSPINSSSSGGGGGGGVSTEDDNTSHNVSVCEDVGVTGGGGNAGNNKVQQRSYDDSFPEIKGRVESKLMSMWHNVKYGWSGKIRSNFSKEQPVWLLGRCYHRKFSPISSMENSVELTTSLENKLFINDSAGGNNSNQSSLTSCLSLQNSPMHPSPNHHHHHQHHQNHNHQHQQQQHQSQNQQQQQLHQQLIQHSNQPVIEESYDENTTVQEFGTDAIEGEIGEFQWEEGIEGFKRDFYSRLWMTYRREFPTMNGSTYTSDCGWGCMIRSGQMLLAQALVCHFLGRSWRWDPDTQVHSTHEDNMHRKIIRWFGDTASKNSPFSIHTLVTLGLDTGKKPGDWYGPSSVSHLLKQAVKLASQENADFDDLHVYVAQDCTVYIQDILDECLIPDQPTGPTAPWQKRKKSMEQMKLYNNSLASATTTTTTATPGSTTAATNPEDINSHWKALILLVPLRLGAEKLNPIYGNSLKSLLSTDYCIGIIGGRPKHSLYFVGFQEDKLIHLDPHYCQEMVDVNSDNFPAHSFHCKSPRKLKLSKLDPCCCIGFYCQTRQDFDNFVASVQPYLLPIRSQQTCSSPTQSSSQQQQQQTPQHQPEVNYPMFVFSRSRSIDQQHEEMPESSYKLSEIHQHQRHPTPPIGENDDDDESDEFVIL